MKINIHLEYHQETETNPDESQDKYLVDLTDDEIIKKYQEEKDEEMKEYCKKLFLIFFILKNFLRFTISPLLIE